MKESITQARDISTQTFRPHGPEQLIYALLSLSKNSYVLSQKLCPGPKLCSQGQRDVKKCQQVDDMNSHISLHQPLYYLLI